LKIIRKIGLDIMMLPFNKEKSEFSKKIKKLDYDNCHERKRIYAKCGCKKIIK
jgi:hypothetical protein